MRPPERPWRLTFQILGHEVYTQSLLAPTDTAANKPPSHTAVLQTQVTGRFIRVTEKSFTDGSSIIYLHVISGYPRYIPWNCSPKATRQEIRRLIQKFYIIIHKQKTNKQTNKQTPNTQTTTKNTPSHIPRNCTKSFWRGDFYLNFLLNALRAPNSH